MRNLQQLVHSFSSDTSLSGCCFLFATYICFPLLIAALNARAAVDGTIVCKLKYYLLVLRTFDRILIVTHVGMYGVCMILISKATKA